MKTNDIREKFLQYFKSKGHSVIPSSSLIPANDPTLLFTNAGMVQFKDVFLGVESADYTRATSSQRCLRAGGKHNDLENVGYTARHHTFFEMLGNFSFGDYFKREAIQFAWSFLTIELGLPAERLWVTVYREDQESEDIWLKEMKIDPQRFSRCGEKDNFWSMGETGPCGPCTEIFFDHGPAIAGGPPGSPEEDGDRYIEIWNLVFMQYNRQATGELLPLPKPSVDTGMGLERISAVMQGVHSNYEIDLFQSLLDDLSVLTGFKDTTFASMRVICDHIRSVSFLVLDGVLPSNEGRGYVLRRIIRRAVRHAHKVGTDQPLLHKMVEPLVKVMGDAYPSLVANAKQISNVILDEEIQFFRTLENGLKVLDEKLSSVQDATISGDVVFLLYDTYGFPYDLTADIAREKGLIIDQAGFDQAMAEQRQRSKQHSHFSVDYNHSVQFEGETKFVGYEGRIAEAELSGLFIDGQPQTRLQQGQAGVLLLDKTPFYPESGGQVGDQGWVVSDGAKFWVKDTRKQGALILHFGEVTEGTFQLGQAVTAEVDQARDKTRLNHSATHLLHAALEKVLGEHVQQKGSLVTPERLRFDFSHSKPLTADELNQVETLVNEQVRLNTVISADEMSLAQAREKGAKALFGEKYGDQVRVIGMGEFSTELCGGTHVDSTGEIGLFKIVNETGIASGVRRIEALTGEAALSWVNRQQQQILSACDQLKSSSDQWLEKLSQVLSELRQQQKEIDSLKQQLSQQASQGLLSKAETLGSMKLLVTSMPGMDRQGLRQMLDQFKQKLGTAAVLLATVEAGKVVLVAGVTKDCLEKITAPTLLQYATKRLEGKGGGRPEMAQGGGEKPEKLEQVLAEVIEEVKQGLPN